MNDISSECGAFRCRGCGRVIGSSENGHLVIRHKGRTVRVNPIGACEVQIVCDKPSCKMTNVIVLVESKTKEIVETLDKNTGSRT